MAEFSPIVMRMRCGCEGGGKGALLSVNKALTLAARMDLYLFCSEKAPTITSSGPPYDRVGNERVETEAMVVDDELKVRRITPLECERLQGFPDDYTKIPWKGKSETPDGPRYKALGNSMAVPCMRWIAERILKVENGEL